MFLGAWTAIFCVFREWLTAIFYMFRTVVSGNPVPRAGAGGMEKVKRPNFNPPGRFV